jgi:hypothetical protein
MGSRTPVGPLFSALSIFPCIGFFMLSSRTGPEARTSLILSCKTAWLHYRDVVSQWHNTCHGCPAPFGVVRSCMKTLKHREGTCSLGGGTAYSNVAMWWYMGIRDVRGGFGKPSKHTDFGRDGCSRRPVAV